MLYAMGIFDNLEENNEKNNCKIILEKENEVVYSPVFDSLIDKIIATSL